MSGWAHGVRVRPGMARRRRAGETPRPRPGYSTQQTRRQRRCERRRERKPWDQGRLHRVVEVGLADPDGTGHLVVGAQLVPPRTPLEIEVILRGVVPPQPVPAVVVVLAGR